MECGDTVALWLSGKSERAYPYGIRTAGEDWYTDAFSSDLRSLALKVFLLGSLTLSLLGIGLIFFVMSAGYLVNGKTFEACCSRKEFELGREADVLRRKVGVAACSQRQAA